MVEREKGVEAQSRGEVCMRQGEENRDSEAGKSRTMQTSVRGEQGMGRSKEEKKRIKTIVKNNRCIMVKVKTCRRKETGREQKSDN